MNTINIKHGAYTAVIDLDRGANCISLRNALYGAVILRERDFSKPLDNPYLYGMPILFPVNRIQKGRFEFEGRVYSFPINEPKTGCHLHGFLHEKSFEAVSVSDSSVKARYLSDSSYDYFPHRFAIEITYSLSDEGMLQKTEIFNLSDSNMPSFLGFHTTFNAPFIPHTPYEDITVLADVGEEIERNMSNYLPTGRILKEDDITRQFLSGDFRPAESKISRHYKSSGEGRIELWDRKNGLKTVYANDSKLGWRLFYNAIADDFICLEPQTCMADCQNSEMDREWTGFDFIPPMESKVYVSRIYIDKL